jgi:UDP-N-acetylglucosamine 2-epimerase (non-hydrolysing)
MRHYERRDVPRSLGYLRKSITKESTKRELFVNLKLCIIIGTRPEIIKMAPVMAAAETRHLNWFAIHTGQHYSYNLDGVFFNQLNLPPAKYNLHSGSGTHAEETGKMLILTEKVLLKEKPTVVLVEGDTNSVLAGSLAASKAGILLGHVEAGLRSHDRRMPEEINRIVADHISDYLFAPTKIAKDNLLKEGIPSSSISVPGNTIVDAVKTHAGIAERIEPEFELPKGDYAVLTLHRQENVDVNTKLGLIFRTIGELTSKLDLNVIYPMHPRTGLRVKQFKLQTNRRIIMTPPLPYLQFLKLMMGARLVLTDSGGVQEEACILKVPCVTLRDNTERPETVIVGANLVAGTTPKRVLKAAKTMILRERSWRNPFGDGHAGRRIIEKVMTTV